MSNIYIKKNGNYVNVSSFYYKVNNAWQNISENDFLTTVGQNMFFYGGVIINGKFEIGAPENVVSETCQCSATFNNNDVTNNVTWSITNGSAYASIDNTGLLTINSNANSSSITIQAVYTTFTKTHEMLVTYLEGSTSETTTETVVNPETGEATTTVTTVTENEDGTTSSSSVAITYDENGDATERVNTEVDTSGNIDVQNIEYDENGQEVVTGYSIDTTDNPSGNGKQINGDEVDTEYYAFDTTKAFELVIHFKFNPVGQVNQATILNAKRADPEPWYGFDLRKNGTTNAIQYGAQFASGGNSRGNITRPSDDIYKLRITYNPTVASGQTTFTIYNMLTDKNLFTSTLKFPDLPELRYLNITIGCALTASGEPQRRAVMDVYEFYVKRL